MYHAHALHMLAFSPGSGRCALQLVLWIIAVHMATWYLCCLLNARCSWKGLCQQVVTCGLTPATGCRSGKLPVMHNDSKRESPSADPHCSSFVLFQHSILRALVTGMPPAKRPGDMSEQHCCLPAWLPGPRAACCWWSQGAAVLHNDAPPGLAGGVLRVAWLALGAAGRHHRCTGAGGRNRQVQQPRCGGVQFRVHKYFSMIGSVCVPSCARTAVVGLLAGTMNTYIAAVCCKDILSQAVQRSAAAGTHVCTWSCYSEEDGKDVWRFCQDACRHAGEGSCTTGCCMTAVSSALLLTQPSTTVEAL